MRALVVCDIHEDEEALTRIRDRMGRERFDHLLVCGDLSRSASFAEDFLSEFPDAFVIPGNWDSKAAGEVLAKAKNYVHERRIKLGNGLNVVGFGYSNITPFRTFGELPEEEIYRRMSNLEIDGDTLLMLHCPPKGHFDEVRDANVANGDTIAMLQHRGAPVSKTSDIGVAPLVRSVEQVGIHAGSEAILRVVEEKRPLAAFFGHIHDHHGTAALGKTTLVKVPAAESMRGCIVETDKRKLKTEFVIL